MCTVTCTGERMSDCRSKFDLAMHELPLPLSRSFDSRVLGRFFSCKSPLFVAPHVVARAGVSCACYRTCLLCVMRPVHYNILEERGMHSSPHVRCTV